MLQALVDGRINRTIGENMGLSSRTIEMHRKRMMERLAAKSLSEALHIANEAGLRPTPK